MGDGDGTHPQRVVPPARPGVVCCGHCSKQAFDDEHIEELT